MARLDLDAFNPEPNTIGFRGVDYAIPGEIPLPMIIDAAMFQDKLRSAEGGIRAALADDDMETLKAIGEEQKSALSEMYDLCMRLLRLENPDVPDLELTAQDCGRLLGVMSSGGLDADIDDAILEAIAGPKDERRPPARSKTRKPPASRRAKPSQPRSSR